MKPMSKEAQEALAKLTPESRAKVVTAAKKTMELMVNKLKTPPRHPRE